ncbi:zinc finger protein, putative, partial [Ichthyophthirius multifiliis]
KTTNHIVYNRLYNIIQYITRIQQIQAIEQKLNYNNKIIKTPYIKNIIIQSSTHKQKKNNQKHTKNQTKDMSQQQQPYNYYQQQIPNQNPQASPSQRFQVIQTPVISTGKYKTSLCRHFKNGNCQLGQACHFAHGMEELRTTTDPIPVNIPNSQPKVLCNNYKTIKCQYFQKGYCKNQNGCSFAHGDVEMLSSNMNQGTPQQSLLLNNQDSLLLISIISNLEQVFKNDLNTLKKLQFAQQYARAGDQNSAYQIVNEIMKDPARTEEEKQQYQTIYTNAQIYYQTIYNQQQQMLSQYNNAMNLQQPYYMGMQQQYGKIQY